MTFNNPRTRILVVLVLILIMSALLLRDQIQLELSQIGAQIQQHACPTSLAQYTIERVFQPGTNFEDIDVSASTTGEHALLTPNGGFLRVQGGNGVIEHYGVSMFHQLHCLAMIRDLVVPGKMMAGEASTIHKHASKRDIESEEPHWMHCFNYLAEVGNKLGVFLLNQIITWDSGIICAADSTLETSHATDKEDGGNRTVIDGIGNMHQCRDSKPVWDIVFNSETTPQQAWEFRKGDSIHRVFLN